MWNTLFIYWNEQKFYLDLSIKSSSSPYTVNSGNFLEILVHLHQLKTECFCLFARDLFSAKLGRCIHQVSRKLNPRKNSEFTVLTTADSELYRVGNHMVFVLIHCTDNCFLSIIVNYMVFHFRQLYSSIYVQQSSSIYSESYWSERFLLWTNTQCHKISNETVRAMYPCIQHVKFYGRISQTRIFYINCIVSLDSH